MERATIWREKKKRKANIELEERRITSPLLDGVRIGTLHYAREVSGPRCLTEPLDSTNETQCREFSDTHVLELSVQRHLVSSAVSGPGKTRFRCARHDVLLMGRGSITY